MTRLRLVHLTTTDVSLDWLLGPQLRAFGEAGYEVVAMSAPGPHVASLAASGIRHVQIESFTRAVNPTADVRAALELRTALRTERPTILHTHNPKPGFIGRVIGHRVGVPVVVNTVHGLYAQKGDPLRRRLAVYGAEALALRGSDAELVQNIEDVATVTSLAPRNRNVVHLGNGIDLCRFHDDPDVSLSSRADFRRRLGIAHDAVVVGMVGRLVWEKGYREFFDAIERLRSAGSGTFEFVVIGPSEPGKAGAVDEATLDRIKSRGVHVLDARPDLENVYPAFDIFVLPSYREGFPRAAMEASAMGVPVVASNIRGCRQVVAEGLTGRLVPVREALPLADAIAELAASKSLRTAMGRAGVRRAAERFDQRHVIDTTLDVYAGLLAERGFGSPQPSDRSTRLYVDSISVVDTAESNDADLSNAA